MTDFPILNGAPVVDILASAKRNALPPAEREAQDLCDAYAGAIAVMLTDAIKSFPVPIGMGKAPAPRLARNLADRIVGEISAVVFAAIEGAAAIETLDAARELARADKDRRIEIALKMLAMRFPIITDMTIDAQTAIVNAMEDFAQATTLSTD